MLRTYKIRLYPKQEQQERIDFTLERCRLLYNRLLDERIHAYRTAESNGLFTLWNPIRAF